MSLSAGPGNGAGRDSAPDDEHEEHDERQADRQRDERVESTTASNEGNPRSQLPMPQPRGRGRNVLLARFSELGTSAQAAIPGLYAWSITVAPAAWSRGAPFAAKTAAILGVVALVTAPLVERAGLRSAEDPPTVTSSPTSSTTGGRLSGGPLTPRRLAASPSLTGPAWARIGSVWGFVLSSAVVWAMAPAAFGAVRMDGIRGVLGIVGWGLFAFASAGPSLRADPTASARIIAGSALKPRSELPRGDGAYVAFGVTVALAMQAVGWGIASPERAVLVRLVTVVCGVAVLGATTSIALARHLPRAHLPRRLRMRRALAWVVLLAIFGGSGLVFIFGRAHP